nr:MAG TPA_asm: hypothetical protein [Caudoviricetes sp.]
MKRWTAQDVFRIHRLLRREAWFDENFAYRAQDKD